MNMRQIILLLTVFVIGLMSCDKYSDYQMIIDNRTNDTIMILFNGNTSYTNGTDTILVKPQSKNMYYNSDGRTMKNWNCDPQINKEEVIVKISNNKTLKKDISNKDNWNCETDKKNTYWKMTFIIAIDDIE
jgi:hypothetical protein